MKLSTLIIGKYTYTFPLSRVILVTKTQMIQNGIEYVNVVIQLEGLAEAISFDGCSNPDYPRSVAKAERVYSSLIENMSLAT